MKFIRKLVHRNYHWVPVAGSDFKIRASTPRQMKVRAQSLRREPWTVAWAKTFRPDEIAFDIGANVGVISLLLGQHAQAYAFEPGRFSFAELTANIKHNKSPVTPVSAAVSDRSGEVQFFYNTTSAETAMNGVGVLPLGGDAALKETVQSIAIDDFDVRPDHLYIDTDGHETAVLRGAQNSLRHVESMICEFLSEGNYQECLLLTESAGLKPIIKWTRIRNGVHPAWFQVFFARDPLRWGGIISARAKNSVAEILSHEVQNWTT